MFLHIQNYNHPTNNIWFFLWWLQVDVTEAIEGHSSYLWGTREILDRLDLDAYYPIFKISHSKH